MAARAGLPSPAEIHVGYVPSGTVEVLPRALRVFQGQCPGVHVTLHDLSAEEMQPLLLQKKLDLALTVLRRKLKRELGLQELARYETCVAVGATHPRAKLKFVRLEQMASEPVATYRRKDDPGYNENLAKMFATIGRKPCIGSEYDSGSSLIAAVADGHEFALLPSCVQGAAGVRLKFLQVRPALLPWIIVARWRKDAETEPVRAFIDVPAWVVAKSNTLAELRGWTRYVGLQIEYSLLERTVERELVPMAKDQDMTVLA